MGIGPLVAAVHWLARHRGANQPRDPEKAAPPPTPPQNGTAANEGAVDPLEPERQDDGGEYPNTHRSRRSFRWNTLSASSISTTSTSQPLLTKVKAFLFPRDTRPAEYERFVPNYRYSPIISGIIIPFSILLEIPGLTERWYVQTENGRTISTRPNTPILKAGMGISIGCAILANICLILRFSEKWVKQTTLLCIFFLTVHDAINITAVTVFGVVHRKDDGYTYGESFWMTLCSTIASTITNLNLIIDYIRIPDFANSGSGLTRKQRSLVVLVIILLMYIAIGALISSELMSLTYIDGLFFVTVSIETIGFGDIVPYSTGARVFTCFYIAFGIIILGIVISLTRDTLLEGFEVGYRKRLRGLRARRREARRFRRWQARWRDAVEWRLRAQGSPVWIPDSEWQHQVHNIRFVGLGGATASGAEAGKDSWFRRFLRVTRLRKDDSGDPSERKVSRVPGHPFGKHLNIDALSCEQLQEASLEAGVPLGMIVEFIPPRPIARDRSLSSGGGLLTGDGWPAEASTPTDAQLGRMASVLTKTALAVSGRHAHAPGPSAQAQRAVVSGTVGDQDAQHGIPREHQEHNPDPVRRSSSEKQAQGKNAIPKWARREMEEEQKNANMVKLAGAWTVFLLFWFVGAAIFSATENWTYGVGLYFCFISFCTTGYGDYAPASPAGRSIFVVWALFGVGALTILAAVIEDAGSSRYRNIMHSRVFDKAVEKYRKHALRAASEASHAEYQRQRTDANTQTNGEAVRGGEADANPDEITAHDAASKVQEAHAAAQRELEALPQEILKQARTFHDYIQYFAQGRDRDDEDLPGEGGQVNVPKELKKLLNEILEAEVVGDRMKREILQDDDVKQTLFMLSIERALKRMIQSADRALMAIKERDALIATHEEQKSTTAAGSSANESIHDVIKTTQTGLQDEEEATAELPIPDSSPSSSIPSSESSREELSTDDLSSSESSTSEERTGSTAVQDHATDLERV
ncbi:uncharacterized protein LAESUDRAFT_665671 [Laetiporus sulphureus 93-53]|uniref:Potassium channel domain-containing protein n=1 Tax=Laetiporus sulphureus 93-53 TaxID=1314785 RepID=A0A165BB69_9APHY|nr:uncharacterized protein LAESUDRAFT_665671 [Laetiporus sulphureus 93-53]KZT00659.1 hypothetical protein LAESUDRAFT_665671 [Laetiporus sulphureus 93-53]